MSVNVKLFDGKWFEVADGDTAEVGYHSGELKVFRRDATLGPGVKLIRTFGPGAWVTWDEEEN